MQGEGTIHTLCWSPESDQTTALIVWDVKTGQKMRSFQGAKPDGEMDAWPAFLWSHDDAYFARMGDDCIYCYESSSMKLIKDEQVPLKKTRTSSPMKQMSAILGMMKKFTLAPKQFEIHPFCEAPSVAQQ